VQITLNIPDGLAERLIAGGKDPAEATLEALAVRLPHGNLIRI
jgi:hypothetical protein